MTGIAKLKFRDDGTTRVTIELALSFPQPSPSTEPTIKRVKIAADIPEGIIDPKDPLLWTENRILEALSDAIFRRKMSINKDLHNY
ncbi:hypothetical protein ACLEIY_01920 [Acetobacter tropicalis]|uniref:hypothetical protein n=1 Tax=Acetobacter TaxID=434 RepID=UPI0026529B13|nr:hypothetical protein [Acetobacter senegalensis]MDN7355540.1 hypothetical protein [Acetobacter senegalensis]